MIYKDEKDMYPDIIKSIEYYMEFYGYKYKVFKTWQEFKPELSDKYQKEIDILGNLGKPDIMVLYAKPGEEEKTLIIEAKKEDITILNIAQAKMYGDIFNADNVFLVGPFELRRQIRQYYEVNKNILAYSEGKKIKFVQIEDRKLLIHRAFPEGGEIF